MEQGIISKLEAIMVSQIVCFAVTTLFIIIIGNLILNKLDKIDNKIN